MFERPQTGERAALIHVSVGQTIDLSAVEEFHLLVDSAGAENLWYKSYTRAEPEPRYFIGKGQAEEIAAAVKSHELDLVIFNAALSPSQERNLEKLFEARVLDRSGLVLDIFAQRARSHEGKLQVELAQLNHLSTRLIRGWTHLERQKGGIGLRGPGETQLETDRRLLSVRIKQLQKKLLKVQNQRDETRKNRLRHDIPTVALAGYTNSGKSTLFNQLTEADVYAKNQLFATLDPTWRKLKSSMKPMILLADTVGFINDLPHELVVAFKSTLEETTYADLILHVIDSADDNRSEREAVVQQVLAEIGASDVPTIIVHNKIDLKNESSQSIVDGQGQLTNISVSAKTGEGLDKLAAGIRQFFLKNIKKGWLQLAPTEGALRAEFFSKNAVIEEQVQSDGMINLHVELDEKSFYRLQSQYERQFDFK